MKKTHTAHLSLIVGTLLMLLDQFFWTSHANVLNTNNVGLLMSALQICHIATLMGLDLVILSLGYIYSNKENSLSEALKLWIYTVVAGIFSAIICFLLTKGIDTNTFYSIFFPVIIDLLSFGDGYSVPFTFILFYLGVIEAHEDNHFSFIPFIIVGLMDVLCVSIMPLCSDIVHGDMSTALRFTTSTSFFEVMIACLLIRLLKNIPFLNRWSSICYIPIASLVFIGAGRLENIVSWNETLVGISSKKLFLLGGFEAFLIVLIILLLTACLMRLPCIKTLNHAINKHFENFEMSEEWIEKEIQYIEQFLSNHKINIVMLIFAYILSYASFISMNTTYTIEPSSSQSYNIFFYIFFRRQFFVLLNTFVLFLVARFLLAVTRHYWFSVLITGLPRLLLQLRSI